jgi:ABC-type multidrug transport system fused ATPase/permease subunit
MYNITLNLIKKSKKELILKIITSFLLRGLLLVIPIYWSKVINNLTDNIYNKSYYLVVIIILLAIFYYIFQYLNQVTWFKFYDKLYLEYTKLIVNDNKINNLSLAEYTNIINNDIDIICTFLGNLIVRIFQILEFLVIYLYFLSINIYIFLITVFISIVMLIVFLKSGNKLQIENTNRKDSLDKKTSTTHKMYSLVRDNHDLTKVNKIFYKNCLKYLKDNKKFNLLSSFYTYLVLGIIELSKYLIIIYSIYLIRIGNMEIGTILLIYSYYDKIITNFEVVGTISTEYQSFVVSLKRLNKVGS